MAEFPILPRPSSVSAPSIIDPLHRFSVDQGYEVRRTKFSRPRRRYEVIWRGLPTRQYHELRDFVLQHRLGLTPFSWTHPTAYDTVASNNTSPVWLSYAHGLTTGQWIWVTNSQPNTTLNGIRQVVRADHLNVYLPGTVAGGAGVATVSVHFPYAVARFPDDTWEAPEKHLGPEQTHWPAQTSRGYFTLALIIEEIF